jgi:hypothetical protein
MGTIKPFLLRLIATVLSTVVVAYLVRNYIGTTTLLADINGVGWVVGGFATIYTFVAAFTIVEVWGQYSGVSSLIAREAKATTAIWNFTDYLNDKKLDAVMSNALVDYLKESRVEFELAASGQRAIHPSEELIEIQNTIDLVKFNDKRDASVFSQLMMAYEELSLIRSERIEASVTRLPLLVKILTRMLSAMLLGGFMLLGFVNLGLYIFAISCMSVIVVYVDYLINDLDNPFDGIWNVDYLAFDQSRKYILGTKHSGGK